jgi:isopenicillin N synthase-like dioxygenase
MTFTTTATTAGITTGPQGSPVLSPIPVIDISGFFSGSHDERQAIAKAVGRAYETIGFLVVTGHGVAQSAIDAIYDTTARFFALRLEEKMSSVSPVGERHQGFTPNANPYDETPLGDRPVVREGYHSYRYDTPEEARAHGYPEGVLRSMPANLWPAQPADFEPTWKAYFGLMEDLANKMLGLFSVALDLPEDWFAGKVDQHLSSMAANCYPEQRVAPAPGQIRVRAHVDFSTLTILYQDDAPGGLQAHQRGVGWVDVPYVPGSFVINLGDLMARWTNDRWVATPHRVVNPPPELALTRRISLPFFHLPNDDAVIEPIPTCVTEEWPARFVPVVAGEWTKSRREYGSANVGRIPV